MAWATIITFRKEGSHAPMDRVHRTRRDSARGGRLHRREPRRRGRGPRDGYGRGAGADEHGCAAGAYDTQPPPERDALGLMEVAFEGNYTREQIKPVIDQAMTLYGVLITEENYSRAASVLVVMRQENGVNEMDILSYMIRSHVPGVNLTFPESAAISAVFLALGDK